MEPFLGQIQPFGFNFAPRGWLNCAGQVLSIAQNTALFSLLGTTFGGNGQTTFGIPDLRGRGMINQGQGPGLSLYTMGEAAGTESTTLTQNQMPQHTHAATSPTHTHAATATSTLTASGVAGDKGSPAGRLVAAMAGMYGASVPATNVAMDPAAVTTTVTNTATAATVTNAVAGGSQPFDNRSPWLCINVCIATQGIFPPRN